jgi:hypothetical protein
MKLKLLTLLLTVGIIALGTGVNAADDNASADKKVGVGSQGIAGDFFCKALKEVITDEKTWPKACQEACAGSPEIHELAPCAALILKENNSKHPLIEKVYKKVEAQCKPGWTTACNGAPCKIPGFGDACKAVCCNIDKELAEKDCAGKGGCDKYIVKAESIPAERAKASW